MRWDVFCQVVDNHGDLGVCLRLARDLCRRDEQVRLWVDDPRALAWMAPQGIAPIELVSWTDPAPALSPRDIVIEAFGCNPPPSFVAAMAAQPAPPLWINLEYLSAEHWVERCHGLPSPQASGPGAGLQKWFFFPGFTASTGGLLREPHLIAERASFDRDAWLARQGIRPQARERLVSVFCYPQAPLDALAMLCADTPTLLLLCGGAPAPQPRPGLGCHAMPWLGQDDYDRLLWSCDLNAVRGEDSLVRAIWAGAPFLWQLYPQDDGAHALKLQAFAERFGSSHVEGLDKLWRQWNSLEPGPMQWPDRPAWQAASLDWRDCLAQQDDLVTQLRAFAAAKLRTSPS